MPFTREVTTAIFRLLRKTKRNSGIRSGERDGRELWRFGASSLENDVPRRGVPSGRFPLGLLCDHGQNRPEYKVSKIV